MRNTQTSGAREKSLRTTVELRKSKQKEIQLRGQAKAKNLSFEVLRESFQFVDLPWVEFVEDQGFKVCFRFTIEKDHLSSLRLYVHWGSYADLPEHWDDSVLSREEINELGAGLYQAEKLLPVFCRGNYGATVFASDVYGREKLWAGREQVDDLRFRLESDIWRKVEEAEEHREKALSSVQEKIASSIRNFASFEDMLFEISQTNDSNILPEALFEETRHQPSFRRVLKQYYRRALEGLDGQLEGSSTAPAETLVHMLANIGLREVCLVAPEGIHAMAGGLARVMEGLMECLSEQGIAVTLITPLYEYECGSTHKSAADMLRDGVWLQGEQTAIRFAGEVDIPFGPAPGNGPHHSRTAVYMAKRGNVRIAFLRNERYANVLYPSVTCDEQLRRAVFLSRGALEVVKNPAFGIFPQLLLSNDWQTALVPVLLKLDERYSTNRYLESCKAIHLIHNGGSDYHGRLPIHFHGGSLFTMLELHPDHLDGLKDPHNPALLNLTAAAVNHIQGGVLAVSKPYAEQMLRADGGEGLDGNFRARQDALFGISNGIDQGAVRARMSELAEEALADPDIAELFPVKEAAEGHSDPFVHNLVRYKGAVKLSLQRHFGLEQNPDALLLSFVGRIAEQKGIQLLCERAHGDGCSVLESILHRYPQAQIIVAGPMVGDGPSEQFRSLVEDLRWRFHGRVAGVYSFVHHHFAMKIFAGSDVFLMPSRYEPGGITQLEALACGTLVIARRVGGIAATLEQVSDDFTSGESFLFGDYSPSALRDTICYCLNSMQDVDVRYELVHRAAEAQHDWRDRMPSYLALFQHIAGVLDPYRFFPHLQERAELLNSLRP